MVYKNRAWDVIDVLRPIAGGHGCCPARVALAWLLSGQAVTSVIVGAKRPDQLADNLAAVDLDLSDDELASLYAASVLGDREVMDARRPRPVEHVAMGQFALR